MALTPINLLKQLLLRSPAFSTLPNAIGASQALEFQRQQHRAHSFLPFALSHPSLLVCSCLTGYACSLKPHNVGIPQSSVLELLVYSLCTHLQNDLIYFHGMDTISMVMAPKHSYPSQISPIQLRLAYSTPYLTPPPGYLT